MNIFVLSENPTECAKQYLNKHVVKMVLETAQILCSAHHPGSAPYKRTHYNHPCSIWARSSIDNYLWLCQLGIAISNEYTNRYNRRHKSQDVIEWCQNNLPELPEIGLTEFAQAMPDKYKISGNAIKAYKQYYEYKRTIIHD